MIIDFKKLIFSARANSIVRRIAWLSLISITLSVMSFLIVLFVMNGMNKNIERRTLLLEPHLVVTPSLEALASYSGVEGIAKKEQFQNSIIQSSRELFKDELSFIDRFEKQDVIIRTYDGQFRSAVARGISIESMNHIFTSLNELFKDRYPEESFAVENLPQSDEVLIGSDLARALNILPGDFITLVLPESLVGAASAPPQVVKLQVKKIISTDLQDLDSQMVYYRIDTKNYMLKSSRGLVSGVELWFKQGYDAQSYKDKFISYMKKNHSDLLLQAETWRDRNSAVFFALNVEKTMIGLILALAGLIASSSIVTVILLLISEKRQDIAILKTLGLSNKRTIELFMKIGFSIAQIGLISGVALGLILGLILEYFPIRLNQEMYYDPVVPASINWWLVLGVFVFGSLLALIGTYLPSKTVTEVNIAESIKK